MRTFALILILATPCFGADWEDVSGGYVLGSATDAQVFPGHNPPAEENFLPSATPGVMGALTSEEVKSCNETTIAIAGDSIATSIAVSEALWDHISTFEIHPQIKAQFVNRVLTKANDTDVTRVASGTASSASRIVRAIKNVSGETKLSNAHFYFDEHLLIRKPGNNLPSLNVKMECRYGDNYVVIEYLPNAPVSKWKMTKRLRDHNGDWIIQDDEDVPIVTTHISLPEGPHVAYYSVNNNGTVTAESNISTVSDPRTNSIWKTNTNISTSSSTPGVTGADQERDDEWGCAATVVIRETVHEN